MIRIAHVSGLHVLSRTAAEWRRIVFNKRLTGYANLLLHRGRVHRREYLLAVLSDAAGQADHLVVTGDVTNLSLEHEYEEAAALLDEVSRRTEVTVVPGNHDIYLPSTHRERRFPHHFDRFIRSDLPTLARDLRRRLPRRSKGDASRDATAMQAVWCSTSVSKSLWREGEMADVSTFHVSLDLLEAGLEQILASPQDAGALRLIVRRPRVDEREVLDRAELTVTEGLVGDNWCERARSLGPDHVPDPDAQLNIMNARVIALIAQQPARWALAGDQLFLDLDLTAENAPPGTRLALGTAVVEITAQPHTGCGKFAKRFGVDATKFVNSSRGRQLRLRGVCARVVQAGTVRVGDVVRKLRVARG